LRRRRSPKEAYSEGGVFRRRRIPKEAYSEGGGAVPDISIFGNTAVDDPLASKEVVWSFFLRVGVHIGLLGVTVESISSGEIGTRYWTGEQGAAAVVAAA